MLWLRNVGMAVGLVLTLGCPSPGLMDGGFAGGAGGEAGGGMGGGGGGGNAGGSGGGTAGGSGGGGGGGGGSVGPVTCTAPARLEQLYGKFSAYASSGVGSGFVDPQTRRLFVWPSSISSSLKSLITIRLVDAGTARADGGANAFVEALPVSGEIPTGVVTASTFDPVTGRAYAVLYCRDPFRYEVESFAFSDGGVVFTRYASTDAPDANGYLIQEIGVGGNQLGASRGNAVLPVTLTATTASWGPEVAGNPFTQTATYDAPNHRTLGIGGYQYLGPMMYQWIPEIKSRGAVDPSWTVIPMSGMGPAAVPSPAPAPYPFIAFDKFNNRLLVTSSRPGMIGMTPVMLPTVFEANLATKSWTFIGDLNRSITAYRPFATDPHYPQVFDSTSPLEILSLAKGSELRPTTVPTSGEVPPQYNLTAATRLPDGRVLASVSSSLYLFTEATRAWALVRGTLLPIASANAHSLTLDAANNRVLLFGGQYLAVPSNNVWALDLGTFALTQLATTGTPPPARWNHSAIAVKGQLIVAGGTADGAAGLGDVWALNLTTLAWKKLADVPPRSKPAVIARDNEVWVIGGWKLGTQLGEPSIAAVDVTTGTVRAIAVQGAWPPRQGLFWAAAATGDALLAIDSGDSIDYSKNQLWELVVTNSVASWRNSDADAMDDSLNSTLGVSGVGCEDALFLGPSTFKVRR